MSEKQRRVLEATMNELQRRPYGESDCQLKTVCFKCRNGICRSLEHSSRQYQVGWKFEYPKKRLVKEWAKLELAMKNNDKTHPMVKRATPVITDGGDSERFSWAHLYGNSHNTPRIKFPRKKQYIKPFETATNTF